MTDIAGHRASDFSIWLRTGRWPARRNDVELKFNPWHDPDDGRFTFANTGRYFARGGGASGRGGGTHRDRSGDHRSPPAPVSGPAAIPKAGSAERRRSGGSRGWLNGGFTGGGGGSFGGGGASGRWDGPEPRRPGDGDRREPTGAAVSPDLLNPAGGPRGTATVQPRDGSAQERLRSVERNGYIYLIDEKGRTRRITGAVTMADAPVRSRRAQSQAGGADRRRGDDGGHYIAARFNGPTEAFNHFAQDANFNRGRYRLLEDQWASAKRAGKQVTVKIVPHFKAGSLRPEVIDVSFTINGVEKSVKLHNEKAGVIRGRR